MADYRVQKLFVNGYRLKQLGVVSLAAEAFWTLAFKKRRGMGTLTGDCVTTVVFHNVVKDGRKRQTFLVALSKADSQLALRVAHAAVSLCERNGFRVLDAVVPQYDGDTLVSEHDLVCERTGYCTGLSSVEVKLRQRKSTKLTLPTVRRQVQMQVMWRATGPFFVMFDVF